MKTAIVIAEQSQPVYNLQGQRTGPVCLVLNQMLGCKASASGVSAGIKLFLGACKPHELELRQNLTRLLE